MLGGLESLTVKKWKMLTLVCTGNEAVDSCFFSPASSPVAITVASSGPNDFRSYFSNFGPCVDLYAPVRYLYVDLRNLYGVCAVRF